MVSLFSPSVVPVGFSETQLTLDEGSMGSLDIRIPQSFLGELEADAQVSVTLVLQRQEGEIGMMSFSSHLTLFLIISMHGFMC